MLSPHVYPTVGQRGELENDFICIHHTSRRLDLQSPHALRLISADHSPHLIDNMYLTGVHSTNPSTTSAFMPHLYIPESTPNDITNIIATQLVEMHTQGIQTFLAHLHNMMIVDSITNTFDTTFLDDEPIASGTYVTTSHLEGTPHTHVVNLPTFSPATYSLTLLASRQLRCTTTLPQTCIPI